MRHTQYKYRRSAENKRKTLEALRANGWSVASAERLMRLAVSIHAYSVLECNVPLTDKETAEAQALYCEARALAIAHSARFVAGDPRGRPYLCAPDCDYKPPRGFQTTHMGGGFSLG